MGTALRVEWRKTFTTRTWWVLLLVMVPYVAAIAAFIAFAFSAETATGQPGAPAPTLEDPAVVTAVYGLAMPLGYVFPALIGILLVTTEYRHKTITSTLLGETRRPLVVLSKFALALPLGLLYGVLGIGGSTLAGAAAVAASGNQTLLSNADLQAALGRSVLGMTIWALIGVGFGLVLRNQIAAIVTLLAFSQLVEPIARIGLAAFEATESVSKFLPGSAGDALVGSSIFSVQGQTSALLEPWAGGVVLLAYAAVLGVIGTIGFTRRDVA